MKDTKTGTKRGAPLLFHKETILILGSIAAALVVTTLLFFFLWTFFKTGFVWVMAFFAIFMTRKTDAWKLGFELHYPLTFLFSYVFGVWFALPLIYVVMAAVVKVRPDELNGALVHLVFCTLIAIVAAHLSSMFGLSVSLAEFTFIMLGTLFPAILMDCLLTFKIAPVHWIRAVINHVLDLIISYFFIQWIGYKLLQYLIPLA